MVSTQWKLGVSLMFVSAVAFAEQGVTTGSFPVERRNVVTVSVPIQNQISEVSLEGERVMGERFSVGLGVFASFSQQRSRFEELQPYGLEGFDQKYHQFGLAPSVRFYLTGQAPQGLWLSPRLEVGLGLISGSTVRLPEDAGPYDNNRTDFWTVGGAAVVGYSVVLEPGFTVQGGVGLGARREARSYVSVRPTEQGGVVEVPVHQNTWNLTQRIVLNVGWAF
ncbi:DUF3575 domain-containing protein [Corallococcus sp. AB011P]|uniref:DUF3575 domain-containing protein n=1 Tax=unclassified Corallococcus TaxID=2685029 RepID=UPI000EA2F9EB|nr:MULTISPECIES: DUF3575 domain-containing protein [unclassified Corallococcus]RKG61775.1 DUF3575 domain-containing protein [Corallococcus sp. AB011P]RKH90302.1 DUF3575 domain-containing protein [Corallococcus sp. AB045]